MEETVYHITRREDWLAARSAGEYTAPSLTSEGFIHFSTREQVLDTARRYYAQSTDLILLEVDSEKTSSEWRWEDAGHGVFPHLYGPLNLDAVRNVWVMEHNQPSDPFVWPDQLWTGTAEHD